MRKLILASASPRRSELLTQAHIEFEVCPSQIEEIMVSEKPQELVMGLAEQKAMDVAGRMLEVNDQRLVLGSDTVVVYDGKILGKPLDTEDASRMLHMLSGHTHQVYTGCSLIHNNNGRLIPYYFFEKTDVHMYELTDAQIEWYIQSGEPFDKAGAYGIQGLGAVLIESISGDYNSVVGLPLSKIWQYLDGIGEIFENE